MARPRDYQREKVYTAERPLCHKESITALEGRRITRQLCALMGLPIPKLVVRSGGYRSFYSRSTLRLRMAPAARIEGKPAIWRSSLYHELAHHIIWERYGFSAASHGPQFARTVASLYILFGGDPDGSVLQRMRETGVDL